MTLEDDDKRESLMEQHTKVGKSYKKQVHDRENQIDEIEAQLVQEALKLPNKTHYDSPVGGENENQVVAIGGPKIKQQMTSHLEIGRMFDLMDFANASKLTGSKFVFLKNEAAMLELALCNWAMTKVMKRGFTPITTPDIARQSVVEACGF